MKRYQFDYCAISNIIFSNINPDDYPKYTDAFIAHAEYNGQEMDEDEIDDLNDNHREYVYEKLIDHLNGE